MDAKKIAIIKTISVVGTVLGVAGTILTSMTEKEIMKAEIAAEVAKAIKSAIGN